MAHETMNGVTDPETIYTKQNCIGGGSFGKVYKGVDKRTGQAVAIKVIDVENAEDEVDDIIQEISILSELHSPYVTKYYGSYLKGSDLWIVMEFCAGGSCGDLLKPGLIPEDYICIIIRELLMGLEYLHGDNKLHRDIKAANILLTANGQVKLADFGVSGQLSQTMTKKNTFVGTPFWMAPEVIKQSGYDHKADIWSLGITALELANGEPPYSEIHPMKVLFLIPKNPPPQLGGKFSDSFKNFVERCLRKEPRERPSAKELLKDPFMKKAKKFQYLTELIERHERWRITHKDKDQDSDEEEAKEPERRSPGSEDLWDFGTIKPGLGGRNPALMAMSEAAANARQGPTSASETGSPRKSRRSDVENQQRIPSGNTIKARQAPPGLASLPSLSPTRKPVPTPAGAPYSPSAAARVPLPPSPEKANVRQSSPLRQIPSMQASPAKPSPVPQMKPVALDMHDYLQHSILKDISEIDLDATPKKPISLGPPITLPQAPTTSSWESQSGSPSSLVPRQDSPSRVPSQQKPLPPIAQQPLPMFAIGPTSMQKQPSQTAAPPQPPAHLEQKPLNVSRSFQNLAVDLNNDSRRPSAAPSSLPAAPESRKQSFASQSLPLPSPRSASQHLQQNQDNVTALTSVVIPALESALHRRAYNLNAAITHGLPTSTNSSSASTPLASPMSTSSAGNGQKTRPMTTEEIQKLQQTHEIVRRLVSRCIRCFTELDEVDARAPVGMGGGVEGFLEGFLEEVLVRVEAVEEDEQAPEQRAAR
ncbi:hypothetical protein FKW77_003788 [Venturia effusa]|uniref:non-specific serine/threonine protein kinase n=1 Tax=Venturia effusa TaxID=50376 RepID=A0A517KW34_9PEZI|nr:hypothetical protein FKW77_003788 [Venturia effusa]